MSDVGLKVYDEVPYLKDVFEQKYNQKYLNTQIKISFNWLAEPSADGKIYFEYSKDHSNDWQVLPSTVSKTNILTNSKPDTWLEWVFDIEPSYYYDFFGHHIQFRWCYEPNTGSQEQSGKGFYIDDFSVWLAQELNGRPIVSNVQILPNEIINDSRDTAEVTFEVRDYYSKIDEVSINLSTINSLDKVVLTENEPNKNNGANLDYDLLNYNITISVPPEVPEGDYVLKITAINKAGRWDNNYVKLSVRQNNAPSIIDFSPALTNLTIFEGEQIQFYVEAIDLEDGDNLDYKWYFYPVRPWFKKNKDCPWSTI